MQFSAFFNLRENPFGECPDPAFYFPALPHEAALRKLSWAIDADKSFVLVEGEVGHGKTMLTRMLHSAYADAQIAVVVHPYGTPQELLAAICRDFGFAPGLEHLQTGLLAAAETGRRSLLVIDEAQGLSAECLELVRQLTNLETNKRKLLQVVLFAQPELGARLTDPALRQLEQRLQLKISLAAFSREDTLAYIRHRHECAGGSHFVRFDPEAAEWIWKTSRGAPRMINKICEVALRFAEVQRKRQISREFLKTLPLAQVGVRKFGLRDLLRNFG